MTNRRLLFLSQSLFKITTFKNIIIGIIFVLFLLSSTFQLGHVPGLIGDEGDEGQNIIELINNEKPPLMGERSYIGAWIDYARMPLVYVFGYNALSLRLLTLIASIAFFWFGYFVLTRLFGEISGLLGLVMVTFSPIYFTQQRLSWAITLLPLFTIIIIYLFCQNKKWSPLLVGVFAGLGANTHILFLATLTGLIIAGIPFLIHSVIKNFSLRRLTKLTTSILLALVGFWATFGMQYTNLVLYKNDQGNIEKNARNFSTRLSELHILAPKFISGSVYISSYTAKTFTANFDIATTSILTILIISGIFLSQKRWLLLAWILGLTIHLIVLSYMIEYYALRYFILASLSFWVLSGLALGSYFDKLNIKNAGYILTAILAVLLVIFNFVNVIFPFNNTGGSTDTFKIINSRHDSASALVDIDPLLACITNKNNVFSNNIHIRNRLIYLANGNKTIKLAAEKYSVEWLIKYRISEDKFESNEVCPNLKHFIVTPVSNHLKEVDWPDD